MTISNLMHVGSGYDTPGKDRKEYNIAPLKWWITVETGYNRDGGTRAKVLL